VSAFPFLTVLIVLPAATAAVVLCVPGRQRGLVQGLGVTGALATLGVALAMAVEFRVGVAGFQGVEVAPWIPALGISWRVGVDGISLLLVLLTALLFPLALIGAGESRQTKSFVVWMLVLEAACLGSFLALDLFLFFVFFEVTLAPAYFLIGGWGSGARARAAVKFFLYTFLGSAFLLVGLVAVVALHDRATGHLTFDLVRLARDPGASGSVAVWLFLAFTAAFAVKAPIWPFHTWSPEAYSSSPTAGAVTIAGVMAKLGSYGIIRFDLELFPGASVRLAPLMLTLAVVGILYGAVVATRQRDLKKVVAYSSLSHLGFIVLGLFALTSQSVTGSVLEMANHGLYTGLLFLVIGFLYLRTRTWQVDRLRGLERSMPLLAGVFTIGMLAAIGLPGLNGFVGEFLILIGTFRTHRYFAVAATVGVILAAVYMLWAYQQAFHGRPEDAPAAAGEERAPELVGAAVGAGALSAPSRTGAGSGGAGDDPAQVPSRPGRRGLRDLTWRERAVVAPLVFLVIGIGVYPKPLLERVTPSVRALIAHVERRSSYRSPRIGALHAGTLGIARTETRTTGIDPMGISTLGIGAPAAGSSGVGLGETGPWVSRTGVGPIGGGH